MLPLKGSQKRGPMDFDLRNPVGAGLTFDDLGLDAGALLTLSLVLSGSSISPEMKYEK